MNIMMAWMTPFSLHFARCTDSPCRIEHVKIQCLKDHSSLARTSRWMDSNSGSLWTNAHPTPQIERSGLHEASGSTVYSLCIACTTRKVRPKPESPGNGASPVEPTRTGADDLPLRCKCFFCHNVLHDVFPCDQPSRPVNPPQSSTAVNALGIRDRRWHLVGPC